MSCQCNTIGGPFIAEDPDCPAHGTAAQERHTQIEYLRIKAETENDLERLRAIAFKIADLSAPY